MKSLFAKLSLAATVAISAPYAVAVTTATPTPTLNSPQHKAQAWLFNYSGGKYDTFSWAAIKGATFRFVVSTSPTFVGFEDKPDSARCNPAVCITADTTKTSLSHMDLNNFWWKPGTYYWTVRAFTPAGGPSAWAPTRSFTTTTDVAASIVANALNYSDSPQSKTSSIYITDVDTYKGVDYGLGLKDAVTALATEISTSYTAAWRAKGKPKTTVYDYWIGLNRPQSTSMRNAVGNKMRGFKGSDKESLIDKTIANFNGGVPADSRDAVLVYFGMRAQCKEFADRMVLAGKGRTKTYDSGASSNIKPGMYAFKGSEHATIINAVTWTRTGQAYARISEANFGSGWLDPKGQAPWDRKVQHIREVKVGPNQDYSVVATE